MGRARLHGPMSRQSPCTLNWMTLLIGFFLASLPVGYASEEEETENELSRRNGIRIIIVLAAVVTLGGIAYCCCKEKVRARKRASA